MPDTCPVCESEYRRQADVLFLRGFRSDQVHKELHEESGIDLRFFKHHYYAGHIIADIGSLSAVAISMAQELRDHDERYQLAAEYDGRFKVPTPKKLIVADNRRGRMIHTYFRESQQMRLKLLEFLGRLQGATVKHSDKPAEANQVTNNTLNLVLAGDPDMAQRMLAAMAEKLGMEVRPKLEAPKAEIAG